MKRKMKRNGTGSPLLAHLFVTSVASILLTVITSVLTVFTTQFIQSKFFSELKIERSEIIMLEEKSLWSSEDGGDSGAYEELLNIKEQLSKKRNSMSGFVEAEIEKIKSKYKNIDAIAFFPALVMPSENSGYFYYDLQLKTSDLLNYTENVNNWFTHAKAAYLLKSRPEKNVPDKLIELINQSKILLIRKAALDSFCSITGYQAADSLDFDGAKKYWKKNRDSIISKLTDNGKISVKEGPALPLNEINKRFRGKVINLPL